VADVAGKEFSIEVALDKMQREWEGAELQVLDYRETKTFIVKVGRVTTNRETYLWSLLLSAILPPWWTGQKWQCSSKGA
jgi:hypothetical protein